jgi:hypothetical protein
MKRGMLATIYADLMPSVDPDGLHELYERFYSHEYFVRVLPAGQLPETRHVAYTNFCDIAVTADKRTGKSRSSLPSTTWAKALPPRPCRHSISWRVSTNAKDSSPLVARSDLNNRSCTGSPTYGPDCCQSIEKRGKQNP